MQSTFLVLQLVSVELNKHPEAAFSKVQLAQMPGTSRATVTSLSNLGGQVGMSFFFPSPFSLTVRRFKAWPDCHSRGLVIKEEEEKERKKKKPTAVLK